MLKKLWCWLVGVPCRWTTLEHRVEVRTAYGMFVNSEPPVVRTRVELQRCNVCGYVRSRTI